MLVLLNKKNSEDFLICVSQKDRNKDENRNKTKSVCISVYLKMMCIELSASNCKCTWKKAISWKYV